jgi:hypothetical protein
MASLALSPLTAHSESPLPAQLLGCGSIDISVDAKVSPARRQGRQGRDGVIMSKFQRWKTHKGGALARWCVLSRSKAVGSKDCQH